MRCQYPSPLTRFLVGLFIPSCQQFIETYQHFVHTKMSSTTIIPDIIYISSTSGIIWPVVGLSILPEVFL